MSVKIVCFTTCVGVVTVKTSHVTKESKETRFTTCVGFVTVKTSHVTKNVFCTEQRDVSLRVCVQHSEKKTLSCECVLT